MVKFLAMNTWAVIRTGGKQYKVEEGQTLDVEKLPGEKDSKITFSEVLVIGGDKTTHIGTPLVANAKVLGKIVENFKDKKIRVIKFKPKAKYLRAKGHRQQKTRVLVEKISNSDHQTASK